MDPVTAALLLGGANIGLGLFGGGGGDEVSNELPDEIKAQLAAAMLLQGRLGALTDPAGYQFYGLDAPPADGVPLRSAANQLAFALLPNYVRPSDSLFPGTAPAMQMAQAPAGGIFGFGGGQGQLIDRLRGENADLIAAMASQGKSPQDTSIGGSRYPGNRFDPYGRFAPDGEDPLNP